MRNIRRLLLTGLAALLLGGLLIGCTTPGSQGVNATAAPIAQADTPIPEATDTSRPPSPTPMPPAETPTRATPSSVGGGGSAPPIQLEPAATATTAPPTPAPTATPVPTSSVVLGWLTYENVFLSYHFSYPPEATITYHGTTPDLKPPESVKTHSEYMAWVKTVYPNDLCVEVHYKTGFVAIKSEDETLSVTPCGITGIGDQTRESWEEPVTVNGQPYTASAMRLYNRQTNELENEFYLVLHVDDRLRIDFGMDMMGAPGSAQQNLSEAEIDETREMLLRIVESFRLP